MKTIPLADFQQQTSQFLTQVEQGETLIIIRHGKPIAEISPISQKSGSKPAWKNPSLRLHLKDIELTAAILNERETGL